MNPTISIEQRLSQSVESITYVFHKRYGKCELMDIDKGTVTIQFPFKGIMTIAKAHRRLVFMNEGCTQPVTNYIAESVSEETNKVYESPIKIDKNIETPKTEKYQHRVFKYPTRDLEVGDSFMYADKVTKNTRARVSVHLVHESSKEFNKGKEFVWAVYENTIRVWRKL